MVGTGDDRRAEGAHYTPRILTEQIVQKTLERVAYRGGAEGDARCDWKLKSPSELLNLKICDPAMGSGAFLVQACRWLGDRLVEAWQLAETAGSEITSQGVVVDDIGVLEPISTSPDESNSCSPIDF